MADLEQRAFDLIGVDPYEERIAGGDLSEATVVDEPSIRYAWKRVRHGDLAVRAGPWKQP